MHFYYYYWFARRESHCEDFTGFLCQSGIQWSEPCTDHGAVSVDDSESCCSNNSVVLMSLVVQGCEYMKDPDTAQKFFNRMEKAPITSRWKMMMASTEEGQRNEMMASSLHHRFNIFHHILTILINATRAAIARRMWSQMQSPTTWSSKLWPRLKLLLVHWRVEICLPSLCNLSMH